MNLRNQCFKRSPTPRGRSRHRRIRTIVLALAISNPDGDALRAHSLRVLRWPWYRNLAKTILSVSRRRFPSIHHAASWDGDDCPGHTDRDFDGIWSWIARQAARVGLFIRRLRVVDIDPTCILSLPCRWRASASSRVPHFASTSRGSIYAYALLGTLPAPIVSEMRPACSPVSSPMQTIPFRERPPNTLRVAARAARNRRSARIHL